MLLVRSRIAIDRRESAIGNYQTIIPAAVVPAIGSPADVTELWRGRPQAEYTAAEASRVAGNWLAYWLNELGGAEFDIGTLRAHVGVGTAAEEVFTNLATSGTNIIGQYAAGAAIDDAVGTFVVPFPYRAARIVLGAGGANPVVYTIDGTDPNGATVQDVITATGAGTYEGDVAFSVITRFRSDVDPAGTTDLRVGNGVALLRPGLVVDDLIVDLVPEVVVAFDQGTGTVVPTTAPDGAHDYTVRYR